MLLFSITPLLQWRLSCLDSVDHGAHSDSSPKLARFCWCWSECIHNISNYSFGQMMMLPVAMISCRTFFHPLLHIRTMHIRTMHIMCTAECMCAATANWELQRVFPFCSSPATRLFLSFGMWPLKNHIWIGSSYKFPFQSARNGSKWPILGYMKIMPGPLSRGLRFFLPFAHRQPDSDSVS